MQRRERFKKEHIKWKEFGDRGEKAENGMNQERGVNTENKEYLEKEQRSQ